ncbi:MAG: ABC transporter substrate-binding protein [Candidatus Nitrohelix vancouverensis]|uniref:ABC transporter substrate-binding protein n=1 Tax=Candidatus Nitrohelix vancouverensis TaxID=2705534 RepID=A0A7T0G3Q2_9BACT|nr:MAG: ABC transporter substrate-binding protein [Candidatus Nitrohelix vancouverensis]
MTGDSVAVPTDSSTIRDEVDPFGKAEVDFHSGKWIEAKINYQKFLELNTFGSQAELAYFRLGQIEQQQNSCAAAILFYNNLLSKYPGTSYAQEVSFNLAQCYFELENYQKAEELFRLMAFKHPDSQKRWQSLVYLARLDEKRVDYENAIEKLKRVYLQSEDASIRSEAKELIDGLIDEQLSDSALVSLLQTYSSGYPADHIYLKLMDGYRTHRDEANFKRMAERFLLQFPDHPRRAEADVGLSSLRENPERKIKIAAILPLSGNLALTGQQTLHGIQLAFNQQDRALRDRVQLVIEDSTGGKSPEDIYRQLGSDPNVVAVIGPVLSPNVNRVADLAKQFRLPLLSPTASADGLPELNSYVFRNALTRENQGRFIAEYAVNKLGLKRFVVMHPDEGYGFQLNNSFVEEVESLGAEVVKVVSYNRSQTDFKEQILQMGGVSDDQLSKLVSNQMLEDRALPDFSQPGVLSRPLPQMGIWTTEDEVENIKVDLELGFDAVFLPGFYDKVGLIVPQLVFYNIDEVVLLGAAGWNSPKLIQDAGKYLKNSYFVDGYFAESKQVRVTEFRGKFKAAFNEDPSMISAQSYDAAKILLHLIGEGAVSRNDAHNRLFGVRDFPGVTGLTSLTAQGESQKRLFTLTIERGEFVEAP